MRSPDTPNLFEPRARVVTLLGVIPLIHWGNCPDWRQSAATPHQDGPAWTSVAYTGSGPITRGG
jgi:hypothetical protein